jgi:two-component system chemotaxis sensor kinase CheA
MGTVRLSAGQRANTIVVTVSDDGRGLDVEAIKQTALRQKIRRKEEVDALTSDDLHALVLSSGFSTRKAISDISGRGIGMDVVRSTVERLKGTIRLDSTPGKGCEIHIELPVTLSTMRVLIIFVNQSAYAVPLEFVEGVRLVQPSHLFPFEGHMAVAIDGETVSVISLSDHLQVAPEPTDDQKDGLGSLKSERDMEQEGAVACVILKVGTLRMGCLVDRLGDEQEVVLKPYSTLLKRVRNVSGCTILGTGEICTILNPSDLLRSAQHRFAQVPTSPVSSSPTKPTILLVDDSLTIRAHIKGKLQQAGYEVVTAVDGIDGLNRLQSQSFDAVISDVQMPQMDGFALTAAIRKEPSYSKLPVILFTSLSEEEAQLRGEEAGATAYVIKTESADILLLETLRQLI